MQPACQLTVVGLMNCRLLPNLLFVLTSFSLAFPFNASAPAYASSPLFRSWIRSFVLITQAAHHLTSTMSGTSQSDIFDSIATLEAKLNYEMSFVKPGSLGMREFSQDA